MARERYLLNADEEAINRPGAEIKADTKKSKWDNFWFYHKWHVIIAVIVVAIAVAFIHDMVSKVNPDYQIALMTQKAYPAEITDALQTEIAKYGKDLNGDGKVVVQINNYVIAQGSDTNKVDANQQMASVTRLTADISSGQSMIFLCDDANFKNQEKSNSLFSYLDGAAPKAGATDYDKMRVSWDQCNKLTNLKINVQGLSQNDAQKLLSQLSISMRVNPSDSKQKDYYNQSRILFSRLVYGK